MIHTLKGLIQPNAYSFFVCHLLADRRAPSQPTLFLCVSFRWCIHHCWLFYANVKHTRSTETIYWFGVDLNHTWLTCFPSSKLLVSTDYLTAIASTHSATNQHPRHNRYFSAGNGKGWNRTNNVYHAGTVLQAAIAQPIAISFPCAFLQKQHFFNSSGILPPTLYPVAIRNIWM